MAKPVVTLQQLEMRRRVVDGGDDGNGEEIVTICALAPRSGRKLCTAIIFALQFLLVPHGERAITNVIKHYAIVLPPLETPHGLRKWFSRSHISLFS